MIVVWIVIWSFTKGNNTLALPGREHTDLHESLTEFNNKLLASRDTNPVMQFTNSISEVLRDVFDWAQRMISRPNLPRPVPEIGWLGVTAIATWVGLCDRELADRAARAGVVPLLRRLRLLAGLDGPADRHLHGRRHHA